MLTSENFKILRKFTNFAYHCGTWPFYFVQNNDKVYEIEMDRSKRRALLVKTSIFTAGVYVAFITFRIAQNTVYRESEDIPFAYLMKMVYQFFAYLLSVTIQMNTLLKWDDLFAFLRQCLKFFKDFQGVYLLPMSKGGKGIKFFSGMIFIGIAVTIQNSIIVLKKPEQEHYLTSILEYPKEASILIRIPLILLNLWIWLILWSNVWAYGLHPYLYVSCIVFSMHELDLRIKNPRTHRKLRCPNACVRLVRSLQVLHRFWQISFEEWFLPFSKANTAAISTLALYGAIKITGLKAIMMGFVTFMGFMYLGIFYYKLGRIGVVSQTTLENWRGDPDIQKRKYMRKFLLSIPAFDINIGVYYKVKKTTVINTIWIVINNTITLFFI